MGGRGRPLATHHLRGIVGSRSGFTARTEPPRESGKRNEEGQRIGGIRYLGIDGRRGEGLVIESILR